MTMTRRAALAAGAVLPIAAAAGAVALPRAARAQAAQAPLPFPLHRLFQVGDLKVHALLAGSGPQEDLHGTFGLNVDDATFAAAAEENFIPADTGQGFFTPVLVDAGDARILFDTGLAAPGLLAALGAAGVAPGDVTHVVLTHHHPDHIGGLSDDAGAPTFPDAQHLTGRVEMEWWQANPSDAWTAKVAPLADRFALIDPEAEVAPGVAAVEAYGHTPGHLAFMLTSGEDRLLLAADTANHYVFSLARPDWEVRFDNDKAEAAATRRRLLGMAAAERFPILGYHMPFPAAGFVEEDGDGFRWVPVSYQLLPSA